MPGIKEENWFLLNSPRWGMTHTVSSPQDDVLEKTEKWQNRCIQTILLPLVDEDGAFVAWRLRVVKWEKGSFIGAGLNSRPAGGSGTSYILPPQWSSRPPVLLLSETVHTLSLSQRLGLNLFRSILRRLWFCDLSQKKCVNLSSPIWIKVTHKFLHCLDNQPLQMRRYSMFLCRLFFGSG